MLHNDRTWSVVGVSSPEDMAAMLAEQTWCGCNGFRVHDTCYLFLNDATGPDGAQEYAVVKELGGGKLRQVESLTLGSWVTVARAADLIRQALAGECDDSEFATM